MIGHLLSDFELAALLEIGDDVGGAKTVRADLRPDAGPAKPANEVISDSAASLPSNTPRYPSHHPKRGATIFRAPPTGSAGTNRRDPFPAVPGTASK